MNKLFSKIAALSVGLAMAVGVGVAVGSKKAVSAKAEVTDDTTYSLITSTDDLEAGKSYIITNGTSGTVKSMAVTDNNNNRPAVDVSISNGLITRGSGVLSVTLGGTTDAWTFATENYAGTAGYFASATSDKNYLRVTSSAGTATISFSNDAAVINIGPHSSRTILRYNPNNGSPIFACYSTGQQAVYLWKEAGVSSTYTVTYNGNGSTGGTVPVDSHEYSKGDTATVLGNTGNLVKEGYTFLGWTYSDSTYVADDTITVNGNVTLSAKWYKNDTLAVAEGKSAVQMYTDSELVLSSCVVADGDGALSFDVDTSVSYIASYNANTYTVTSTLSTGGPLTITAHKGEATPVQFTVTVIEKPVISGISDVINREFTGVASGATTYSVWEEKEGTSGATYIGVNAGSNNSVQLRSDATSTKPASGIVTTSSSRRLVAVEVVWESHTMAGRTLDVFASNTAYTAVADLVDNSKKGTLIGQIVKDTSTQLIVDPSEDYLYVGVRSNSGAMYLTSITFTWEDANAYTAQQFATDFLAATDEVCDAYDGKKNNHDALADIWSTFAAANKYGGMAGTEKTLLIEAERDEEGTVIEQAMARYDYLTGKYNLNNFISGRTPVVFVNQMSFEAGNNSMAIIVVLASVSGLIVVGTLLILKKKRHN